MQVSYHIIFIILIFFVVFPEKESNPKNFVVIIEKMKQWKTVHIFQTAELTIN